MPAHTNFSKSAAASAKCSISSGVTFVINTQGPGPFTFNINLSGLPMGSTVDSVNFTVNASEVNTPDPNTPHVIQPAARRPCNDTRNPPRQFLSPRRMSSKDEVPETPQSQLWTTPRHEDATSQNVEAPDTPLNSMPSTDATEDSDDYKDDQLPAIFSPNCQLVSPSRKRSLDHMERDVIGSTPSPKRRAVE